MAEDLRVGFGTVQAYSIGGVGILVDANGIPKAIGVPDAASYFAPTFITDLWQASPEAIAITRPSSNAVFTISSLPRLKIWKANEFEHVFFRGHEVWFAIFAGGSVNATSGLARVYGSGFKG